MAAENEKNMKLICVQINADSNLYERKTDHQR